MRFEPLDVVKTKFYFGIGGIGDFLLLMATCYDTLQGDEDVIFVCNNINVIRKLTDLFPRVNKFWLYPNSAFMKTPEMWSTIKSNQYCAGTGITPKHFDYIGDWIECGKSNVFDYYGVNRNPKWATPIETDDDIVCIQPMGGADDKSKKKRIPLDELEVFVDNLSFYKDVHLIGSESDKLALRDMDTSVVSEDFWKIPFRDAFDSILKCSSFIGCDTWGKTLAGLAGKPVLIYPNEYPAPIQSIFNHPVDPSDYPFLKDWGFTYADGRSF